jgi:alpha-N-arabinofuranosidase
VGPVGTRPRRMELAWHAEESNRFGTDEFIDYCRKLGAQPYICVNMGTGTMDEAQAWVEYCNGTGDTQWANLRRSHGREEPFHVRYWGLGNEMYGSWQIGALSAEDYVKKAREFAKVMTWTDPSIELVSCGLDGVSDWDRTVLEGLAPFVRHHSIHLYTGSAEHWANVLAPHLAEHALVTCGATIAGVRQRQGIEHDIKVAYDEWNVWYRSDAGAGEEVYALDDALAVATYLNCFIRQASVVGIANLAQMVNVIAPIRTRPDGLVLQSIYHPLRIYSEHSLGRALRVTVDCDPCPAPGDATWASRLEHLGPQPLLDVAATGDGGRRVTLCVVNRDPDNDIAATLTLGDDVVGGTANVVNAAALNAINDFEVPDAVGVKMTSVRGRGSAPEHVFPAHSVSVLVLELAG